MDSARASWGFRIIIVVACGALALSVSSAIGCGHRDPGSSGSTTHAPASSIPEPSTERVGPAEARRLVQARIQAAHPTADPTRVSAVAVSEVAVPELWERMRMQVFAAEDDLWNGYYVMRGSEAVELGRSFGGYGLLSICVCDLDGDGVPELAYSCSWGSGMHRTELAILDGRGFPRQDQPVMSFPNVDLFLRKQDDRTVLVEQGRFESVNRWRTLARLGMLRSEPANALGGAPGGNAITPSIEFAPDAPASVRPWPEPPAR